MNGVLDVRHVTTSLTITNPAGFRTVAASSGPVTLQDINESASTAHTFADSASFPYISRLDNVLQYAIGAQTLLVNGAVTIDCSQIEIAAITLQANATSTTITNPSIGRTLTIEWIQDGTGSRTVVWPTNCIFYGYYGGYGANGIIPILGGAPRSTEFGDLPLRRH